MVINLEKSTFYLNGVDGALVGPLNRLFFIPLKEWEGGLKYMGFFLKPNGYKKVEWNWFIERIEG